MLRQWLRLSLDSHQPQMTKQHQQRRGVMIGFAAPYSTRLAGIDERILVDFRAVSAELRGRCVLRQGP
jgi:hypothetical protein